MELEGRTVTRLQALTSPLSKEWWYTGCADPSGRVYLSFHAFRMPWVDNVTFSVFDLDAGAPLTRSRKLLLSAPPHEDRTELSGRRAGLFVDYAGSAEDGWRLHFRDADLSADLAIRPGAPPFLRAEDQLRHRYELLSFMDARVDGEVHVSGRSYYVDGYRGYWDHCSGTVPRRTGWHWLAVQNDDVALVSLLNYGPYPQRYTQLLRRGADGHEWVRPDAGVTFEYVQRAKRSRWRLTGRDIDVDIEILMGSRIRERIPPLLPLAVDLTHEEFFVRAAGRVRVDHEWTPLATAHGVLEEHRGVW